MKENFFTKKLDQAKKGAVIATVSLATFLPIEKSQAQQENRDNLPGNKIENSIEKIKEIETKTVTFSDFNPTQDKKNIKIEDDRIKSYITKNILVNDLFIQDNNLNVKENESKTVKISDYKNFKKEILEVAKELGYSEKDIECLSAHDAIMLSGKILSKKMSYYEGMINESKDSTQSNYQKTMEEVLSAASGIDNRNDEAKRIDSEYQDKIFSEGLGICRNYAAVNMAVFEILKKIDDDNLKNTYMKWYSPSSLGESLALPHAWNQVIHLSAEDKNINLLITYVDPTWLDTRKTTIDASGKEITKNDEDLYNAFDSNHFFSGCLSAHVEIANLYEFLAKSNNNNNIDSDPYFDLAYRERIKICSIALDSVKTEKENINRYEILFDKFEVSFMEAVSNVQKAPVGMSSVVGPTFYAFYSITDKSKEIKIKELKNILNEAKNIFNKSQTKTVEMIYIEGENTVTKNIPFFDMDEMLEKLISPKNN